MPVERLKLFATRTYERLLAAAALAAAVGIGATFASGKAAAGEVAFATAEAAYEHGIGAIRSGRPELAVDALAFAGTRDHIQATYYLGKIYANNNGRLTDHAKAFNQFHRIVEKFAYVDPFYDFRASYVARSFVALAGYYRKGVPALKLPPDPRYAVDLLTHAATYFGDLEAQFELAKMHLAGEGVSEDPRRGLHWLSSLARKNHAGAQAFLADLMWRGKHLPKDPSAALAYISLAVEGARDQDRIWIEEIHQTIFCGTAPGVHDKAGQMVADWHQRVQTPPPGRNGDTSAAEKALTLAERADHGPVAVRTCADGAPVQRVRTSERPPMPTTQGQPIEANTLGPPSRATGSKPPAENRGPGNPALPGDGNRPGSFGYGFQEFGRGDSGRR
jgi:hypothetical protein